MTEENTPAPDALPPADGGGYGEGAIQILERLEATGRLLDQPVSHSNTNFYIFFPNVFSKGGHLP